MTRVIVALPESAQYDGLEERVFGMHHGFMGSWGGMGGWGLVGGLIGFLFLVALATVVVALFLWLWRRTSLNPADTQRGPLSARDVLALRYVRGELTREEYLRVKEDLG